MRRRFFVASGVAALGLALGAGQAPAAVTIGQHPATTPTATTCSATNFDDIQIFVSSGTSYTVPTVAGVTSWKVASWQHLAGPGAGQVLTLKFFRSTGGLNYQAVVHDGPRNIDPSTLNNLTVSGNLIVRSGDLLGLHDAATNTACIFTGTATDNRGFRTGNLADGQTGLFSEAANIRLNITATLDPNNIIAIASVAKNKKKGNATANITVPNPGTLVESGNGVKTASAAAHSSATVGAAGTVALKVLAKGKKKRTLQSTGSVKVNPTFTFTPNGGTPFSVSTNVKLKKKK